MADARQRLVLGTAQWGLDYGITNVRGRLSDDDLVDLVEVARTLGVWMLDTAPAYGDAEERIARSAPGFRVQTKVSGAEGTVRRCIEESGRTLGRIPDRVLVHDWHALSSEQRRRTASDVQECKASGLVSAVGLSGYDEEDVISALDIFEELNVVQVPSSVLDQRLAGSQAVVELRSMGCIVQARSIYLQGLAVSPADRNPRAPHPDLVRFWRFCTDRKLNPAQVCQAFVRSQTWIDEVVLGVAAPEELSDWEAEVPDVEVEWTHLASDDEELLDPRRWSARPG